MTRLQNSLLELTMAWHDPGEASRRALIATKLIEIGFNSSLLNARDYASFVCCREDCTLNALHIFVIEMTSRVDFPKQVNHSIWSIRRGLIPSYKKLNYSA